MDGTYKLNNRNMPLYSLHVVDGEGKGQAVAYTIVRDETEQSLATVLTAFKDNNPESKEALCIVVVDKDCAEINSINTEFADYKHSAVQDACARCFPAII